MAESAEHPTVFDTGKQHLGKVYAQALLNAVGGGRAEAALEEFDGLVDLLGRLPKLDALLSSPRIDHVEKARILDLTFRRDLSGPFLNFLKVVARHGRLDCLRAIHQATHRLYNESLDRVEVKVRSATPLDDPTLKAIADKLRSSLGKEVILRPRLDESLIGGIVIQIGDTVFDGSVANRLVRLREETINNTAQKIRETIARFTLAD
jgi:F-type H+-transporting ATPase subunit delta